jgi:hypothetical protein
MLDFNDDETRRQHIQMIAICLANTEGELINSARAEWHIGNEMKSGKPSKEAMQAAVGGWLMMVELIKAYREFYTGVRAA